jgi:hypothetical protein
VPRSMPIASVEVTATTCGLCTCCIARFSHSTTRGQIALWKSFAGMTGPRRP